MFEKVFPIIYGRRFQYNKSRSKIWLSFSIIDENSKEEKQDNRRTKFQLQIQLFWFLFFRFGRKKKKKKKRFSRFVKDRAQEHRKEKSAKKPKQLIKYIEPTNFLYFYEKSVSQKYPQGNNTSNEDEPFFNYNTTEN